MELFNQVVAQVTFKTKQETIKGEFTFCNASFFDTWQQFLNNNDQTTFRAMQLTALLCSFVKAFRGSESFAFDGEIPNPLTIKSIEILFNSYSPAYQRHGFTLKYKVKKLSSGDGYLRLFGNLISRDDHFRTKPMMVSDSFEAMTLVVGGNMVLHEVNSLIEQFKKRVTHFSRDMKLFIEPKASTWFQLEFERVRGRGSVVDRDQLELGLKTICLQHPANQNAMTVEKNMVWDLEPGSYVIGHELVVKETDTGLHLRLATGKHWYGGYFDLYIRTLPYDGLLARLGPPMISVNPDNRIHTWDEVAHHFEIPKEFKPNCPYKIEDK